MKRLPERSSLRSRLGWFAVLYLGGVLAALMLAAALHVLLRTSTSLDPGSRFDDHSVELRRFGE
jgi:hypothetical protein